MNLTKTNSLVLLGILLAILVQHTMSVGAPVVGPTQLTFNLNGDFNPAVSANGQKVAYTSNAGGDLEIMVMNIDGTGLRQLTSNSANDTAPAISGDGGKIVFESDRGADADIWIVNSDGNGLSQLTQNTADDAQPTISSDGLTVAFTSNDNPFGTNPEGDSEIFTIRNDGTGLRQITFNTARDEEPSLSGNGSKVAFQSRHQSAAFEIWIGNTDGTGLTRLTFNDYDDTSPSISASGGKVAFQYNGLALESVDPPFAVLSPIGSRVLQTPNYEVYVVNSDGTGLIQVSSAGGDNVTPSISGDGTSVAYVSTGDRDREIFLVKSDGTETTRITDNMVFDLEPSLNYDGTNVVFMSDLDGDYEIFRAQLSNPCVLQGDVNGDGMVNIIDLAGVGAAFGSTFPAPGYDPAADLNGDGTVNILDLAIVGTNFGSTCP